MPAVLTMKEKASVKHCPTTRPNISNRWRSRRLSKLFRLGLEAAFHDEANKTSDNPVQDTVNLAVRLVNFPLHLATKVFL